MDRETRDPFDLLDEIEKTLALDTAPLDLDDRARALARRRLRHPRQDRARAGQGRRGRSRFRARTIRRSRALLPEHERAAAIEEMTLAVEGCRAFDKQAFLEGHLTPVLFGSALKEFGVRDLIDAMAEFAPPPRAQAASTRIVEARRAEDDRLRLQDPGQHGPQPSRPHRLHARLLGQAHARHAGKARAHRQGDHALARRNSSSPRTARSPRRPTPATSSAFPTTALLRIGDTLTEGEEIVFRGVPSFAPEILRRVKLADAMKAKKLREALQQMAEEGVVQVFLPHDGAAAIVGVVGALQLDVLSERLNAEYGLPVTFEQAGSRSAAG